MKNNHWLTTQYVAHRGLFDNVEIPENSLLAFEKAVNNNYGIEFDVQMTADGVLVVFHDDDMQRMTGVVGDIREKTWEEIRNLRLIGTQHKIPTFDEMLNTVAGKTPLVIEIKTHKNIGGVEKLVYERLKKYDGSYVIESFNPVIVRWFKVNAPEIIRGQLAEIYPKGIFPAWQRFMLNKLLLMKWNGSQFLAYNVEHLENNKLVQKWRKKLPVVTWTVKSQAEFDRTQHLFDNMIFDSFIPTRYDMDEK
jgi:glycerophosphoryl diester phosphodiesterase